MMYSVKIYLYLCKKDTEGSPLFTEMSTVSYRTLPQHSATDHLSYRLSAGVALMTKTGNKHTLSQQNALIIHKLIYFI